MQKIILPGGDEQLKFLSQSVNLENKRILVAGSNLAPAAEELADIEGSSVEFIVPDYESLLNANLYFAQKTVVPKIMEFDVTDFDKNEFDVIYAQASISSPERKKTIKEFKRILKPTGLLCVGEIIIKTEDFPGFVADILQRADLDAKTIEKLKAFYEERNMKILKERDLSGSLIDFYKNVRKRYSEVKEELDEKEKSYYKKLLKQASHEANAFLEFGADNYIGFYTMLLKMG